MKVVVASRPETLYLLRADPELARYCPPDLKHELKNRLRVETRATKPGRWLPPDIPLGAAGWLVLDGFFVRMSTVGGVPSAEVVGPGDILRPGETELLQAVALEPSALQVMALRSHWKVLTAGRIALLDRNLTGQLRPAIDERIFRRSESLTYVLSLRGVRRTRTRIDALLWHYASRWGKHTATGAIVPFRLTHPALGAIVGAQRPRVTEALGVLLEQGRIIDAGDRYILLGTPPDWYRDPPSRAQPPV